MTSPLSSSAIDLQHTMDVDMELGKRSGMSAKEVVKSMPVPSPSAILSVLVYGTKTQLTGRRSEKLFVHTREL